MEDARDFGLGDNNEELTSLLTYFAERAALVTHDSGNRRFGGYVLDVADDGMVLSVDKFDAATHVCEDCFGTARQDMYDPDLNQWVKVPCQSCLGQGADLTNSF